MKQIFTLLTIFLAFSLTAQTTQKGVVKEYNEKAQKTPLTGVELNVRAANSTVSDKEGNFILQFLSLKPGEKVNVRRIEKLGYEVFNKEAIEQWNLNPNTPFVIVMCKSDRFKKIRDNYEKVSSESYARQLKKEEAALLKLKEQGKLKEAEYQKQLFELRENYENQLDNLENYVDRFSRIDLSELSAVEQEIIALVQEGRIEEAIAKYEDQNYIDKYIKEVGEIKEISSAIDQLSEVKQSKIESRDSLLAAVQRQIETLKLAGGKENFDKIIDIYDKVISSGDHDNVIVLSYLDLLNQMGMYDKCIDLYNTYVPNLELSLFQKEKILNLVGNSYNQLQKLDEAIEFYKEAISVIDQFDSADKHYATYRRNAVMGNMGLAYSRKSDFRNALYCYNNVYPQLDDYEGISTEVKRLNNLALLYSNIDNCQVADSIFNLGIDICKSACVYDNKQKEDLNYNLAILYQGKGNELCQVEDFDSAQNSYEAGLKILKDLFEYNPKKYISPLASLYYNYGRLYRLQESKIQYSIPYYQESLKLHESNLSEHFIQRDFENYAETFANLAIAYDKLENHEMCIELCQRASAMLDVCKEYPYKGAVLMSNIGAIYGNLKDNNKALEYYLNALEAIAPIYDEYPGIYTVHLARLCCNIATTLCRLDNHKKSIDYFSKSIDLYDSLAKENSIFLPDRRDALYRGFLHLAMSSEYKEGLNYLRRLQVLEPDNLEHFERECIILYGNNEKEEAVNVFNRILTSHPDYPKDSKLYVAMMEYINSTEDGKK